MRDAVWTPTPFTVLPFSTSTSGANLLVAGVPLKQIHVFRAKLFSAGIVNVSIGDNSPLTFDGPIPLTAGSGFVLPYASIDAPAWWETSIGAGLVLTLSTAVLVGGNIEYLVF